jgi:hypothetical protein
MKFHWYSDGIPMVFFNGIYDISTGIPKEFQWKNISYFSGIAELYHLKILVELRWNSR